MAIAGGATAAYRCQVVDDQLEMVATSALRSVCVPVRDALPLLSSGEKVLLAGSDMAALRVALGLDRGEGTK